MFPLSVIVLLVGYSATYVGAYKLMGDKATITGLLKGHHVKDSSSGGGTIAGVIPSAGTIAGIPIPWLP